MHERRFVKQQVLRRFSEAKLSEVWAQFPSYTLSDRDNRMLALFEAVSALLAGWSMQEIEEASWLFALDGWQRPPPLVEDYDSAFHEYYLKLIPEYRHHAAGDALAGIAVVFDEFRNRVQFIQSRGADIRMSSHMERLVATSVERLETSLKLLEDRVRRADSLNGALEEVDRFTAEGRADLLLATANAIGRFSPEVGASVLANAQDGSRVVAAAGRVLKALPTEVGSNLVVAALEKLYLIGTK